VPNVDPSLRTSRPRQAQVAERLDIHRRADPRGVVALVPQQLADLRQGRNGAQEFRGQAVPENMGTLMRVSLYAGSLESSLGAIIVIALAEANPVWGARLRRNC